MSDGYERGTMDVSSNLKTYRSFIGGLRDVTFFAGVIISFLVVTFCGGGFGAGLAVAIIAIAIGGYLARNRARAEAAARAAGTAGAAPTGAVEAQIVSEAANRNAPDQHAA